MAAAIATGAATLPTSPVALIWALKKGDEAVLDESRMSIAVVNGDMEVAGLLPKSKKTIYHSTEQLKAAEAAKGTELGPFNIATAQRPLASIRAKPVIDKGKGESPTQNQNWER